MQTHLSLYQHNLQRLAQLRLEANANALARQTRKKPGWILLFARWFRPWPGPRGLRGLA